jgi:hypothetical protein
LAPSSAGRGSRQGGFPEHDRPSIKIRTRTEWSERFATQQFTFFCDSTELQKYLGSHQSGFATELIDKKAKYGENTTL